MRLIEPSVEIIKQSNDLIGIFKHIEKCGRTCYQSYDKIDETSYIKFIRMIQSKGHLSVFEHGTIYLKIPIHYPGVTDKLIQNQYSKYRVIDNYYYATTNLRVIKEHKLEHLMQYICEPTEYHYKRTTVKFILPIGISREFCRHRVFSFSEQSTRYCNFSLNKFNNEITFIIPCWTKNIDTFIKYPGSTAEFTYNYTKEEEKISATAILFEQWELLERKYFELIERGCKPQEARDVLPLSTKSELIMTGFDDDWKQFLELRCSPYAHPDAQKLANMLKDEMEKEFNKTNKE